MMSENFDCESGSFLPHDLAHDVVAADLSDRDLEAVTAGKADTPTGRRDLAAGGGLDAGYRSWITWPAFLQYRYEFWSQFGLAGRRRSG